MKKAFLIIAGLLVAELASAQDFILKNWTDHFSIFQGGHGVSVYGDNIKDSQGVLFLKANSTIPVDSNLVHITGTETIVGQKTFNATTTIGTGTSTQTLDVIAPGNTDALRLYSRNNPSGGSVNPPSIGFYRSITIPNSLPRLRIIGSDPQGLDADGFALLSPASNVNWIKADEGGGGSFGIRTLTANVIGILQQANFTSGTTVFGLDADAGTSPAGGWIRSGAKTMPTYTDVPGSDLTISGGAGTGAGTAGGNVIFQTPDATSSGTTVQNYTTKMQLQRSGALTLGTATEDPSSLFSMQSSSRGFLLPRMTASQEAAISSPATGLQVYNTTSNTVDYYNGSAWSSNGALNLSAYIPRATNDTITGAKTFAQSIYLNGGNNSGLGALETHGWINVRSGGGLSVVGTASIDGTLTADDLTVAGVPKIGFTTSGGVGLSFQDRNTGSSATYGWFLGVTAPSSIATGPTSFILRYAPNGSQPIFQVSETGVFSDSNGYRFVTTNDFPGLASGKKVIVGDANGNIVMTNKITTSDGKDIYKTPSGYWKYVHYADDGTQVVDSATVTFDANGNATVTTP